MNKPRLALLLLAAVLAPGCGHFGASKLAEGRFNYTAAIGDSWKDQMLLNVVKLRYSDVPVFLGVQSVIDQYTLGATFSANANWSEIAGPVGWAAIFGGSGQYSTTPTVTYSPMTGAKFGKSMMSPVQPVALAGLLQAGYPVEAIFRMSLSALGGHRNPSAFGEGKGPSDSDFDRALKLLAVLQAENGLALHSTGDAGKPGAALALAPRTAPGQDAAAELKSLLRLDPRSTDFTIVYGPMSGNPREIPLLTRSMLDVLGELSAGVDVPAEHLAEHRAMPVKPGEKPLLRVHAGAGKPADAFIAVPYHGSWYWIDDRDLESKSVFSFLMFLFTLVDGGPDAPAPSIVIPTGK